MGMLNVEADLRGRLAEALAPVDVRVSVPDPRPKELAVITREGGGRENALIDSAGIGIYCYAESRQRAWEIADATADAIACLPFAAGYARVDMEAMYSDPDPLSKSPRYYLSYTIKTFRP